MVPLADLVGVSRQVAVLRFILPFMVKIWIVGSIALAVAVLIGYS
jgi:hypothetical protein